MTLSWPGMLTMWWWLSESRVLREDFVGSIRGDVGLCGYEVVSLDRHGSNEIIDLCQNICSLTSKERAVDEGRIEK